MPDQSIITSKDVRLLDLPFSTWCWNLPSNELTLNADEDADFCFAPFINRTRKPEDGWSLVLPDDKARKINEDMREQMESHNRIHARLQLTTQNLSRTIIVHGIVTQRDENGHPLFVWGLARPEFQYSGQIEPEVLLANTDFEDKRRLETLLLKTQRFEAMSSLAGGIAHDLNNLLAPIRMATELMQRKLKDNSLDRYIKIISESTDRARSIIQQILTIAKGSEDQKSEHLDPNDIIWELRNMISETFPPRISLDFKLGHVPQVSMDPNQLHQALLNILINARDAIADQGSISIRSYVKQLDLEVRVADKVMKPGRYACISVSDSGHGIPPDIREKIFDPFFTTKDKNKGTGLGLASVYSIIANAGGFIDVESEDSNGSTFYIYLPEVIKKSARKTSIPGAIDVDLAGYKVLVVDDEENVLQTLVQSFKDWEMDVLGFVSPTKALEFVQSKRPSFDFAVIDLHMPSLSGTSFIKQLRKQSSVGHTILITGDTDHHINQTFETHGIASIIHKPFQQNDFRHAFKTCLEARNSVKRSVPDPDKIL